MNWKFVPKTVGRKRIPAAASRHFFLAFAIAFAAIVLAGFGRSFLIPLSRNDFNAPWIVHAHAAIFFSWSILFVTQVTLMNRRRASLHRRLGCIALALIPMMFISGNLVAHWSSARDFHDGGGDETVAFYFGEIMDLVLFSTLAIGALLRRRDPQAHKRLMLLATLPLVGAAVLRIPPLADTSLTATVILFLAIVGYDFWTLSRPHAATLAGGAFFFVGSVIQTPIGMTPWWLSLGTRMLG